jgi:hypothetical protein
MNLFFSWSRSDFFGQFRPTVEKRNHVLHIMAYHEITLSTVVKGFDFCGKKEWPGYHPDYRGWGAGLEIYYLSGIVHLWPDHYEWSFPVQSIT